MGDRGSALPLGGHAETGRQPNVGTILTPLFHCSKRMRLWTDIIYLFVILMSKVQYNR